MEKQSSEESSVTIVRIICQLILTIFLIGLGVAVVFVKPEYSHAVSLGLGILIGVWFGIVRYEGVSVRGRKNGQR